MVSPPRYKTTTFNFLFIFLNSGKNAVKHIILHKSPLLIHSFLSDNGEHIKLH